MADETTATNGEAAPERKAQVQEMIDKAMGEVARQPSPMRAQRERGWQSLAKAEAAPIPCNQCKQPTLMHINGVCRECFIGGVDARAGLAPGAATCGFCNRSTPRVEAEADPMQFLQNGESVIRGAGGGVICSTCAASAAGCVGAKNAAEARRMMASAAMQAAATAVCNRCAGLVDALIVDAASHSGIVQMPQAEGKSVETIDQMQKRADLVLTLGEAAEMFARIARGDQ